MLNRLIALALSQRLFTLVLTLALIGAGVLAGRELPIDAFPDVSTTQVKLILKAPGMTPAEVESRIVAPIEQELLGIPKQVMLRSSSKYAIADITLDFADGTDIYWARQQVSERLNGVMADLPPGLGGGLAPITTPLGEMFMFTVEGEASLAERRIVLDTLIRPRLRGIPGVADVNSLGGVVQTFEVVPDLAALSARQLSISQLQAALEGNNRNDGAGRLVSGEESLLVRSDGSIRHLDDVRDISVSQHGGQSVRVGDVALVRLGELARYGAVTRNGEGETVEGLVLGLRGANARQLVREVRSTLDALGASLPPGMRIVPFYDRGELVGRAIGTVAKALAEATVLVLVLLLLFLGNLRAALVVALILPLSALGTFVLMQQWGLSANLMSLGGLAIAIGMLVDAAVVVVENIEARQASLSGPALALPNQHHVYRATAEVATPVGAGVAIIMIVFLPLLTLQGLEGKLFSPVALTIVFALGASLLLSLTVIPALASWLLRPPAPGHAHRAPWLVRWLEARYSPLLDWALGHTRTVVVGSLLALVAALAIFPLLGKSFMPSLDEGDVLLQVEKLPSVSLEASAATDLALQRRILQAVPEVDSIIARVGTDELGLDPMGLNDTDTFLVLKPRETWRVPSKEALIDKIREAVQDLPGINIGFTQPIEMRTSEMLSGVRGDLAIKVFGPDPQTLAQLAQQIVQVVQTVPGNEDVITAQNEGVQYLSISLKRAAIGRLGLTVEQVQNDLRALLEGQRSGTVVQGIRRVPLMIRGSDSLRLAPEQFAQLRLPLPDGASVPLSHVAELQMVDGPVKIEREKSMRMSVVRANVRDRDLVGFVEEAKAAVAREVQLPPGYLLAWGGQFENQQRAAARLSVVVPVALALILLVLFATLGQWRQALLVFVNIPFALIGGLFALGATGTYLSVPASVGFIALMGIAVLNGLVLVTCFNQLAERGLPLDEVVRQGCLRRLRPVLMTASITALGLVPLLLASGPGSEIQRPLATVVMGGLLSATVLTLFLLPLLYRHFHRPARPPLA
ncbi:CusA/CzcA family heavy metal efflux RND transporter [Curvibacter sp. RS43]|uniref:efflux RND transporter permease subunit n=1 Tax=Curvibacter microcysteis TaxID=3026419 RepID=UPI00235EBCF3|nr:CusA/CzcA family heavy metal efflux RND transporter [Curvibacter sp. RS43]MDD0811091.1 CusA/CzcA family heavy metal efflux RND transporter [Curvibacter sp. RS43]